MNGSRFINFTFHLSVYKECTSYQHFYFFSQFMHKQLFHKPLKSESILYCLLIPFSGANMRTKFFVYLFVHNVNGESKDSYISSFLIGDGWNILHVNGKDNLRGGKRQRRGFSAQVGSESRSGR